MRIYDSNKTEFVISTDKSKLNIQFIHHYLSNESYWAKNIPIETVQKSIDGSFCFAVYMQEDNVQLQQVAFARVVTDHATFAYLADVFVDEAYQGNGLANQMMEFIMNHPELQGLRRWMLATKDAHALYAKFGFLPLDKPERIMGFKPFEIYPETNS